MLNDYYVLVDTHSMLVIDKIQKLPENWFNIAGLPGLTDDQLKNLTWAGHYNKGWINIQTEEIKKYSSSVENLELNKNEFKRLITELRKEQQETTINYYDAQIKSNIKTLYTLLLLKSKDKVHFKCVNGYYTFNRFQLEELYDIIDHNIQKLFNWEMKIYAQIDKCQVISDFLNIKL